MWRRRVPTVTSTAYAIADEETVTFSVPEMDCPSCAGKVENSLDGASGIVDSTRNDGSTHR